MRSPFFSIVIPTHNRPVMLERALESVCAQEFEDYEVIVVNDGSSVSYDEVFEKYRGRIRTVVNDVTGGAAAARNAGILDSRGTWIAFLDDDDEFAPSHLRKVHEGLQNAGEHIGFFWCAVKFQLYAVDGSQGRVTHMQSPATYRSAIECYLQAMQIGTGWGFGVKRQYLENIGSFDTSFGVGEDTDLILRLLTAGYMPMVYPHFGATVHYHRTGLTDGTGNIRIKTRVQERLWEKHGDFLTRHPRLLPKILGWGALISYDVGDFSGGDRMLGKMLRAGSRCLAVWVSALKILLIRIQGRRAIGRRYARVTS
jgi:glycosyltransferase involved in cell wall biosynthesis